MTVVDARKIFPAPRHFYDDTMTLFVCNTSLVPHLSRLYNVRHAIERDTQCARDLVVNNMFFSVCNQDHFT